jgi:predicted RNase H-like HicB family nuclease
MEIQPLATSTYGILLLWSEDDQAFLAQVAELPGCIAHGETREEAITNAQIAIENWLETAAALGRPIPKPMDWDALQEQAAKQALDQHKRFQYAVGKAVNEALQQIVPNLVENMERLVLERHGVSQELPGGVVGLYRGHSRMQLPGETIKRR